MRERRASLASAFFRRIRSKTSSENCGRSNIIYARRQSMELLAPSRTRGRDYTPALVRIPEGWFFMGCDTGQDNEKPVRRVWVDEFLLAARQVTNEDYGRFLRDSASLPPPFWS